MLAKGAIGIGVILATFVGPAGIANAQTVLEQSAEVRMQLDLAVSSQALKALLPDGWEPFVATSGPAKDCKVRLIFVDRVDINGPDGAPAGTEHMVYFASPIKKTGSNDMAGQMMIDGIANNLKAAPDPFNVYQAASGSDLSAADLSEADLANAKMQTAFLVHAKLDHARISEALLNATRLDDASLRDADLSKTNLVEASLRRANLEGANLDNAGLVNAVLRDANLKSAKLTEADLYGADLTDPESDTIYQGIGNAGAENTLTPAPRQATHAQTTAAFR